MPELRKDPIVGRWVIISTERARRPSDFTHPHEARRGTACAFCDGRESETPPEVLAFRRNGGPPNTGDWTVRVVPNKFPALRIEGELAPEGEGIFDRMNGIGAHEVIVETPDHNADLAQLTPNRIEEVLWAYRERVVDLQKDPRFRYTLIFKNHGADAGASLEHTHSQLIALPIIPLYVVEELNGAREFYRHNSAASFATSSARSLRARPGWSPRPRTSSPSVRSPRAFPSRPGFCRSDTARLSSGPRSVSTGASPWRWATSSAA